MTECKYDGGEVGVFVWLALYFLLIHTCNLDTKLDNAKAKKDCIEMLSKYYHSYRKLKEVLKNKQ